MPSTEQCNVNLPQLQSTSKLGLEGWRYLNMLSQQNWSTDIPNSRIMNCDGLLQYQRYWRWVGGLMGEAGISPQGPWTEGWMWTGRRAWWQHSHPHHRKPRSAHPKARELASSPTLWAALWIICCKVYARVPFTDAKSDQHWYEEVTQWLIWGSDTVAFKASLKGSLLT